MTDEPGLERGYRRLLAWYPPGFLAEQGDEMLAVLMAGAGKEQRRPGLPETLDVLRSALRMRMRSLRSGPDNRGWADGLALFSVLAPPFLVLASLLEVAVPYVLPRSRIRPAGPEFFVRQAHINGLSLFSFPGFRVALIGQVIVAALVLLGLRRLALVAMAGAVVALFAAHAWFPYPLQLLTTSVYLLEAAALTVSPGPRHGRHLMNWGHGVIVLLAAATVQAATLRSDAKGPVAQLLILHPHALLWGVVSLVLAAVTLGTAAVLRSNWYLLLLLAVMAYPLALQLTYPMSSSSGDLIGHPTPVHLAMLYLPPLLLSGGAILFALWRHRPGAQAPAPASEAKPA